MSLLFVAAAVGDEPPLPFGQIMPCDQKQMVAEVFVVVVAVAVAAAVAVVVVVGSVDFVVGVVAGFSAESKTLKHLVYR